MPITKNFGDVYYPFCKECDHDKTEDCKQVIRKYNELTYCTNYFSSLKLNLRKTKIIKEYTKLWKIKTKGKRCIKIFKDTEGYFNFHFETGQVFKARGEFLEGAFPEAWTQTRK